MKRPVLIIEDEYFLADDCAHLVRKAGFDVVGPFRDIEDAKVHITSDLAGALLDVNVDGSMVYQLIDELLERGVPIMLYTGYEKHVIPEKYSNIGIVIKPQECRDAVELLCRQMACSREHKTPH